MTTENSMNKLPGLRPSRARRHFIGQVGRLSTGVAVAAGSADLWSPLAFAANHKRLKVAAVLTEFAYRSHAHVLLENFLEPYLFNGKLTSPGMEVVSFYVAQLPDRDMARDVAANSNLQLHPTLAAALRLGGDKPAVGGI